MHDTECIAAQALILPFLSHALISRWGLNNLSLNFMPREYNSKIYRASEFPFAQIVCRKCDLSITIALHNARLIAR